MSVNNSNINSTDTGSILSSGSDNDNCSNTSDGSNNNDVSSKHGNQNGGHPTQNTDSVRSSGFIDGLKFDEVLTTPRRNRMTNAGSFHPSLPLRDAEGQASQPRGPSTAESACSTAGSDQSAARSVAGILLALQTQIKELQNDVHELATRVGDAQVHVLALQTHVRALNETLQTQSSSRDN